MIQFLRQLPHELSLLREAIERLRDERKPEDLTVRLMRRLLCSIDVEPKEAHPEAFRDRVGPVFKDFLEPLCRRMAREQERFIAAEAADLRQSDFGRGTLNGIELVREELEKAFNAYTLSHTPPESFDRNNPLPE